jgi:hypothetical protein
VTKSAMLFILCLFFAVPGYAQWNSLGTNTQDVAVSNKATYAIRNDKSIWRYDGEHWTLMPGNGRALAITTSKNDDLWVIGTDNAIYRFSGGNWIQAPGGGRGKDIAVDAQGIPWVLGTDDGIYSLHGSTWVQYPGGGRGTAISISPDGTPFVVGTDHGIYRGTGSGWVQLPGGGLALDIAVDGSGHLWVIGTDQAVYTHDGTRWTEMPGGGRGTRISIASPGHPVVVGQDSAVWRYGLTVAKTASGQTEMLLVGKWEIRCCSDTHHWVLSITQQEGNSFTGSFSGEEGNVSGSVSGDRIEFDRSFPGGSQRWTAQLEGAAGAARMVNGKWSGTGSDRGASPDFHAEQVIETRSAQAATAQAPPKAQVQTPKTASESTSAVLTPVPDSPALKATESIPAEANTTVLPYQTETGTPEELTKSFEYSDASMVMAGLRQLQGANLPEVEKGLATAMAPYFLQPTEGTQADLARLRPLVEDMVSVKAAVAASADAFDAAWNEAVLAASMGSEEGTRQALAIATQHQTELESQQARLSQLAKQAKALGDPRDPVQEYRRVSAEHKASLKTALQQVGTTTPTSHLAPTPASQPGSKTNPYGDNEITEIKHVNVGDQPKAVINPLAMSECCRREMAAQAAYEECRKQPGALCRAPVPDPSCDCNSSSEQSGKANPGTASAPVESDTVTEKEKQERIEEIDSNLRIIRHNISLDEAELGKETDASRRAALEFRLLQSRSDAQAEQDLKTSMETGQLVHTRSPFDDYSHDRFVESIQENQQRIEQFQRGASGLQRLAALLPPGEDDNARAFIARQLGPDAFARLDLGKVQEISKALNLKVQGYAQKEQAKSEEGVARAQFTLDIAENIKTGADAGMMACSLAGGQALNIAYQAGTGYFEGGLSNSLVRAASTLSTPASLAVSAMEGYRKDGWTGAGQNLAIGYLTGKVTQYALGQALSCLQPTSAPKVRELFAQAKFKQDREGGIALVKDFERANGEVIRLRVASRQGGPGAARKLAEAEAILQSKAATINQDMHAKNFLKYKGEPVTQVAYNKSLGQVHDQVQARFHEIMQKDLKWGATPLREFRNASSAGSTGMDYDIGLDQSLVGNLSRGGKPASIFEWQNDAQGAWNRAYQKVTNRSATRSWETVTTNMHPEAYRDLAWLGSDKSAISKLWAQQGADVTRYKAWHLAKDPNLSGMEKLQEISRGTAKDMSSKLLPLLQNVRPGSALSSEALAASQRHWNKVNSVLDAFGRGQMDPVQATRRVRELTGGKSIHEVVEDAATLMESIGRNGQ